MYAITFTTPGFMMYRVLYNFLVLNPCDQSRLIYLWGWGKTVGIRKKGVGRLIIRFGRL